MRTDGSSTKYIDFDGLAEDSSTTCITCSPGDCGKFRPERVWMKKDNFEKAAHCTCQACLLYLIQNQSNVGTVLNEKI